MSGIDVDHDAARTAWLGFCAASGVDPGALDAVEPFGDGPAMADELLALVLSGRKRATAGLVRDAEDDPGALGVVGGYWLVVDGRGAPACVLRTTELRTGLLDSVDDAFAHDEGEGDRTRAWWLAAHRDFFTRQGAREGRAFDEDVDLVAFERFELVHRC